MSNNTLICRSAKCKTLKILNISKTMSKTIFIGVAAVVIAGIFYFYNTYDLGVNSFSSEKDKPVATLKSVQYSMMGNKSTTACKDFSVLTWNVWFGTGQKWDAPAKRWVELLHIVVGKKPDVIGFQECTADFLKIVQGHTEFSNLYVALNDKPAHSRYFVMIYKRKELKTLKKDTITFKTQHDRRCEYLDVEKEGAKFRFGTVHIESYVTSPNIREIQMGAIFDVLQDKKAKNKELAFLVGDFNFHETDKENKFIETSQFKDTWRVVHKEAPGYSFESKHNLMNQHAMLVGEGISTPTFLRFKKTFINKKKEKQTNTSKNGVRKLDIDRSS
eukprot:TCONS_00001370-protein